MKMGDEYFGPALPPQTSTAGENDGDTKTSSRKLTKRRKPSYSSSSGSCDSSSDSSSDSSDESEADAYKYHKGDSEATVGHSAGGFIGPVVPLGFLKDKDEDNEDIPDWGPKLSECGQNELDSTVAEIEQRAHRMKNKLLNLDDDTTSTEEPKRETWMMELPPEHGKNFGLTARKFSTAAPSGDKDRSVWTDTPADRAKKAQDLLAGKLPSQTMCHEKSQLTKRDTEYSQQIEEFNRIKKRDKSLLELHNEKNSKEHLVVFETFKKKKDRKHDKHKDKKKKKKSKDSEKDEKKKKKKEAIPERRPFDRDMDLKVNRLDSAQKQAIIKRSQQLSSRFKHGTTTGKFL